MLRNVSLKTLAKLRDYVRANLNQTTAPTTSLDFWPDAYIDQQINAHISDLRGHFYEDAYDFTSLTTLSAQIDYAIPSGFDERTIHRIELWDSDKSSMMCILKDYRLADGKIILSGPIGEDGDYFKIEGQRYPYQLPATPLCAYSTLGMALATTTASASASSLDGWPDFGYFTTNQGEYIQYTDRTAKALYGFTRGFNLSNALSAANSSYVCACFNGPTEAEDLVVIGSTAQLIRNMMANRIMYTHYAARVNRENGNTIDIMRAANEFEQQYREKLNNLSRGGHISILRHEK